MSLADPTIVKHKDKYYLYATGGAAWVSSDLVHWDYHPIAGLRCIAPSIIEFKGAFYMIGNDCLMYRATEPLGPWTSLGRVKDENGAEVHWADWMLFLDDDGTMYAYHNSDKGIGTDGIFVTKLDTRDLTRTVGPTANCFAYDPSHLWERRGDKNEDASGSWIEAGWMTKHNGRYYLQYSAPGTEYVTYAVGVYTAQKPMGPFTYAANSPILTKTKGLLVGPGHHAIIEGPDGRLWAFYHVLVANQGKWDRRLAMDRVEFDAKGAMTMSGPTDTPQWGPLATKSGDVGLVNLAAGAKSRSSSAADGHPSEHAFTDSIRSWWAPAAADGPHWLSVDLGDAREVSATRLILLNPGPFRYTIETSIDEKTWTPAIDMTGNALRNYHYYDTFAPAKARYIKVTFANSDDKTPLGVINFAVFGTK